ncbi:hypothetical protein [Ruminococcus bicirculans (ex Wegman et al. 2014)]|uniref:hypothetical protein n=1 Tax=Ruminococcus bicirculans (ex Wegman et al. 2014) TaxID=1160721 RepID=UPI0020598FCE|nr:MAG TPA: hypothetical protein [Cressdnaviricota sp.]
MYIIKGFKKNSGTLKNGKPWENYTLFCLKDEDGVTGYSVQAVKVPVKVLQDTFPDSSALIDTSIRINYDIRTYNGQDKAVVTGIDIL